MEISLSATAFASPSNTFKTQYIKSIEMMDTAGFKESPTVNVEMKAAINGPDASKKNALIPLIPRIGCKKFLFAKKAILF